MKQLLMIFALASPLMLSGCNTLQEKHSDIANACEQGIRQLGMRLKKHDLNIQQTSLSRANSLLQAAQIQSQFAEYPGCLEKIQRAEDYLSGRQTAIISRLSI